MSNIMTS